MKINIDTIKETLSKEEKILVITGAGVSTLSGIPDFSSLDNTWKHDIPREIAMSAIFFRSNPQKFWEIYRQVFEIKFLEEKQPSNAHQFLVDLEKNSTVKLFTQNVDGLHQKAGSADVINLHGDASIVKCLKCKYIFSVNDYLDQIIPMCECGGKIKPMVTLFGEYSSTYGDLAFALADSYNAALIMGTSLNVAPVNRAPSILKARPNVKTIYWDKSAEESNMFHMYSNDDFSEIYKK